jgi:hypothetical protein
MRYVRLTRLVQIQHSARFRGIPAAFACPPWYPLCRLLDADSVVHLVAVAAEAVVAGAVVAGAVAAVAGEAEAAQAAGGTVVGQAGCASDTVGEVQRALVWAANEAGEAGCSQVEPVAQNRAISREGGQCAGARALACS